MKHVMLSLALALGSLLSAANFAAFTNSVNVVIGLHETADIRIAWSNPPLDEATGEMHIEILDANSVVKYSGDHEESAISVSTAGWAAGTYTVVSTLPGFEEVDYFTK